jgi:NAD(P)-dependent dehydrogenase (short-subunit alcohol dehydrogenase family)
VQVSGQGLGVGACAVDVGGGAGAEYWHAKKVKSGGIGVLVNTGSVGSFWATAGAGAPITAYATSEFATKGFSEVLVEDLRANAPQVRVVVAMPGTVNTDVYENSRRALGHPALDQLSDAELLNCSARTPVPLSSKWAYWPKTSPPMTCAG